MGEKKPSQREVESCLDSFISSLTVEDVPEVMKRRIEYLNTAINVFQRQGYCMNDYRGIVDELMRKIEI